jgi:hypothetical protein
MGDLTARFDETYTAYQTGLGESYLNAAQAASEAQQRLAAELFAAAGGDDSESRAGEAWRRYQQDVAKASYDYWGTVSVQQLQFAESMSALQTDARTAAFEWYQSQLGNDGATEGATEEPRGSGAGARQNRSTRSRGSRSRSDGQSG